MKARDGHSNGFDYRISAGTTVQPRGDYHCTIEAKTGKIAVVSLVKY